MINYCSGEKIDIFSAYSSLDKISSNSIILYYQSNNKNEALIREHLKDFRLVGILPPNINIYVGKNIQWKK
jgi:hypothetical protein